MENLTIKRKILFTPGPLNTSSSVRAALSQDIGSRTKTFTEITCNIVKLLQELISSRNYHPVLLQGSGTFAIEAMIGSLVPTTARLLVLSNGVYGERIAQIANRLGIHTDNVKLSIKSQITAEHAQQALEKYPLTSHMALAHGETSTGLVNPISEIADVAIKAGKELLIDAMSTFGANNIDFDKISPLAVAASSNKGLEGPPGVGLVFAKAKVLQSSNSYSRSICLDIVDQYQYFITTGQWRFTPPTNVVLGLYQALLDLLEEGGIRARELRHIKNREAIIAGFQQLGFHTYLPSNIMGHAIVTFYHPKFNSTKINAMTRYLYDKNIVIYPGLASELGYFRVGCIGDINAESINALLQEVAVFIKENANDG